MLNRYCRPKGLSLTELLIALGLLGLIAAFAIPKVLQTGGGSQHNAQAKEVARMIKDAYDLYRIENRATANTLCRDLTPYMNYVAVVNSGAVDDNPGHGTTTCGSGNYKCLRLHSGGMLLYDNNTAFGGTSETRMIWFDYDPDGKATGGSGDAGKAVGFFLYFNGHITSGDYVYPNSNSTTYINVNPGDEPDPDWFSWDT